MRLRTTLGILLALLIPSLGFTQGGQHGSVNVQNNWVAQQNFKNAEMILFADQWPGANTGAQVEAACAGLFGSPGIVIVPSNTASGNIWVTGVPDNCRVWDHRGVSGPNQFGTEGAAYLKDTLMRARWTQAPNSVQNYEVLHLHGEPWSGGYNTSGGPKTTYMGLNVSLDSRTQGSHFGAQSLLGGFGEGDEVGQIDYVYGFGGSNAAGDEGNEALHFEADQGFGPGSSASSNIATATVGAATPSGGNTILALTSGVNLNLLGELRWVIDTTPAKIYSTGTISNIVGTPPVVTGSGTMWTSLTGGQYCFSLNGNANGILLQVIPVTTISSDTSLTLGYSVQGSNKNLSGLYNSGSYQIFPCSQIAAGGLPANIGGSFGTPTTTATITVSNGYTAWSASDTMQVPLAFDSQISGGFVNIGPLTPLGIVPVGLHITNLSGIKIQSESWGIQTGFGGWWSRHWECDNGSQDTTFACLSAEDSVNPITYSVFNWQETANTLNGWAWNSGTDVSKIGFDRTSGQFCAQDNLNGDLFCVDQGKDAITGRVLYSEQTNVVGADFTFTGWGSGVSGIIINNNSKDQAGQLNFQSGTSPSASPTIKLIFHGGAFPNAPFCQATLIDPGSVGHALYIPTTDTYALFDWAGSTPAATSGYTLIWSCPSGG